MEEYKRPTMKDNLPNYTFQEAHKLYSECPLLYRHIVKLDNYIDIIEDQRNELLDFANYMKNTSFYLDYLEIREKVNNVIKP